MKKKYLLAIACLLFIVPLQAQDFEFFINIENANETFTIPVNNFTYTYDYNVEIIRPLPEATIATYNNVTESLTHTFANPGLYLIKILEDSVFPAINFSVSPDRDKITNIASWGNNEWATMERAFENCTNLTLGANNTPNLTNVTSTNKMFKNATSLTDARDKIGDWDMSNVQDMEQMFRDCTSFNEDLSNWDTSNVQILHRIFQGATLFNQNLGNWDVSNVTGTAAIFRDTALSTSNYDKILTGWGTLDNGETQIPTGLSIRADDAHYCTSEAIRTTLSEAPYNWVFTDAGLDCSTVANEDFFVTTWETTNTNESITIPTTNSGFNYYIDWGDGTTVNNVSGDATHTYSAAGTYSVKIYGEYPRIFLFNAPDRHKIKSIDQWGSIQWENMSRAFEGASNLRLLATDVPDLSGVTNASYMFAECTGLESPDLSQWDTSSIYSMNLMFYRATNFNSDISGWDVGNCRGFQAAFKKASTFNQDLSGWNIGEHIGSHQVLMNNMFETATSFNRSLASWDISKVTNMTSMLSNSGLSQANYDATLIGWATLDTGETQIPSNINLGAIGLNYCEALHAKNTLESDPYNWIIIDEGPECTDRAFITTWQTDTANESITIPTTGSEYYYLVDWGDGTPVTFETGNAPHTYATAGEYTVEIYGNFPRIHFNNAGDKTKIVSIDQWGNNIWTTMMGAFRGCSNLTLEATDTPNLSQVDNISNMFLDATMFVDNGGEIGNWNVSNITSMIRLFQNTSFNSNINNWDVRNVEDMQNMFANAIFFNQPLNHWELNKIISLSGIFQGATNFNQDISAWNTDTAQFINTMFRNATSFNNDISGWNVSNVRAFQEMFWGATSFNQNLGDWDISQASNMKRMFNNSGMSTENYDATLIGWAANSNIPNDIELGALSLEYCTGEIARDLLTGTVHNWMITGDNRFCGVRIAPKVYLQGAAINPFAGEESLMRDGLLRANVIPITSPYPDAIDLNPDIFSILNEDALVDWVWVELRDANDHTQIVASKSALLQRDGDIVDAEYETLSFENVPSGNYYVAIKHRNHLGILTTSTISLSETVTPFDLSTDVNTVMGGALALRDMGNGIFAMYAGDTTGDGNILNVDISNAINASGGINVYSGADANMDGNILNTDIQLIIQPNAGRIQQF